MKVKVVKLGHGPVSHFIELGGVYATQSISKSNRACYIPRNDGSGDTWIIKLKDSVHLGGKGATAKLVGDDEPTPRVRLKRLIDM